MSNQRPTIEDSEIGVLIHGAGPLPEVPPEHLAQLQSVARKEWERRSPIRRAGSWLGWATAAVVVGAVLSLVLLRFAQQSEAPLSAPQIVATVEVLTGEATITGPGSVTRSLHEGASLASGDTIEVTSGVAALRLPNGLSLRFREGSRATLDRAELSIHLEKGAVYADSGVRSTADPMIRVSTAFGTVTDIGTQFELRVRPGEGLRLRVREGSVRIDDTGEPPVARAGEELEIDSEGTSSLRTTPTWGPDWLWILEAAPPFETAPPTLSAYIDWLRRETGWEIDLHQLAEDQKADLLQGSIAGLRPDQSIDVVLTAFDLSYRLEDGKPSSRRRSKTTDSAGFRPPRLCEEAYRIRSWRRACGEVGCDRRQDGQNS